MSKQRLTQVAGGVWGIVGTFLIYRGTLLYQLAVQEQNSTQQAIIISLVLALVLGLVKGRFVLSKTARRNRDRIDKLTAPLKVHQVFAGPFYGFIAGMMLLGFLIRTFNTYLGGYVVVGAVYCGIGMALLTASRVYWKTEPETPVEKTS
ncbi:MAG: hypothetical protein IID18_06320 [Nitrospinae bacterium]|nr:hypothetical protein [Nitrospinota bacterium]